MLFEKISLPFAPPPSTAKVYEVIESIPYLNSIERIAKSDYGHGKEDALKLLTEVIQFGSIPFESDEYFHLEECISLASFDLSQPPLTRYICWAIIFHIEGEDPTRPVTVEYSGLAKWLLSAAEWSKDAVFSLAPFGAWLAQSNIWCPRSLISLFVLLSLHASDQREIRSEDISFLKELADQEIRMNISEVLGYENDVTGYEDVQAMISEGELHWLFCLDPVLKKYDHWLEVCQKVLGPSEKNSPAYKLFNKIKD